MGDLARGRDQAIDLIVVNANQRAIQLYRSCSFMTYDEQVDQIDPLTYLSMKKEIL